MSILLFLLIMKVEPQEFAMLVHTSNLPAQAEKLLAFIPRFLPLSNREMEGKKMASM